MFAPVSSKSGFPTGSRKWESEPGLFFRQGFTFHNFGHNFGQLGYIWSNFETTLGNFGQLWDNFRQALRQLSDTFKTTLR